MKKVKQLKCILAVLALIFVFHACTTHGNRRERGELPQLMLDSVVGSAYLRTPVHLGAYFDSLGHEGYTVPYHADSLEEVTVVMNSIDLLQKYQDKKLQYYPKEAVLKALDVMRDEISFLAHHAGMEIDWDTGFMEYYLEQAVRLCPYIGYLTDVYDENTGILSFEDNNAGGAPLAVYIAYRDTESLPYRLIRLKKATW